jgi:hypothetical protein
MDVEVAPSFAFNATHKFVQLSIEFCKNESRTWNRMWFIIDTGCGTSYIRDNNLDSDVHGFTIWGDSHNVLGYGKKFSARKSSTSSNSQMRNVNLLGGNFLDHFVLIIDSLSKSIVLLKREPLEVVRNKY